VNRESFVETSVARRIIARLRRTHERRRISIFSGPPGIGKTTAVDAFKAEAPDAVAIVKVARQNAREVLALQHTLESVRHLADLPFLHAPSSVWELRNALFGAICQWAGADAIQARRGQYDPADFRPLTIVFDEAQNFSRAAIDALRYWNDPDRCYAPFPVGMVFVGNSEFSLKADAEGRSPISTAVADRALYVQALEYADLTDADLEMFLRAKGLTETTAVAAVLKYFRTSRAPRSLRRVEDLLDDLFDLAEGGPVTDAVVQEALFVT
jgi:DNA transposition AAA+ family ATPase